MATSSTIQLNPTQKPAFSLSGISGESAQKVSELLQKNHDNFHIFFNQNGFHNHIAHHLLTLFALRATPSQLQKAYDDNATYQRPAVPVHDSIVSELNDTEKYKTYLANEKYYHDFLIFFQQEIDKKGWQAVLNEYVFKGDERADDMLVRMFAGFLHPIIHLGFGVEFEQPAIIAEALAQAAVHDCWIGALFYESEKAAKEAEGGDDGTGKTIVQLIEEIQGNEKLKNAAHWEDGNKIRDGVLKRAKEEMVRITKQFRVREDELEKKTAEMINAAVFFTSTAQRPPHVIKFDFFYMHCVNSSIFFSSFLHQPWLSSASKCRLLEWKVRIDLAMYASRGSPRLLLDEITNYEPKHGVEAGWDDVFERVTALPDDGHASKLVRALANGERVCKKWEDGEDGEGFVIKGDMWRKLGHATVDSVEGTENHWVRSCGFEEAWKNVPLREGAKL